MPVKPNTRYSTSRCLTPVKLFFKVEGTAWYASLAITGYGLGWSIHAIVAAIFVDAPHDPSWAHFSHIACLWFLFNMSAMLFLGLLEGPTWGVVGPKSKKFELFPLFSWQTPAVQQAFFFWPCAFFLAHAIFFNTRKYYQFPAHGVASLFGQQARELVLFDSDKIMVQHHVLTMFLSMYIWWGMQSFCKAGSELPDLVALNGLSVAALEAGGLGVCLWMLCEWGQVYWWILSVSHVICLGAGWYSIYLQPSAIFFYVTFALSVPLIRGRHTYMTTEVARGKPSGEFD